MMEEQVVKVDSKRRGGTHHLWWWVRLIVAAVLSAYLVWQVRAQVGTIRLHLIHPVQLILALAGILLAIACSTWQWKALLPPDSPISFSQLLAYYLWGFFWNNFLPSGFGGDAVRVWELRSASGQTDSALSSVLMARLAGIWSVALLAVVAAPLYIRYASWGTVLPLLSISVGALVVTAAATVLVFRAPRPALAKRLPAAIRQVHEKLQQYSHQPRLLLQALAWALVIQLCAVAINSFVALALGLDIRPWQLLLGMPLINLATFLPISLGGFGVREGSYILFLGLVGVPLANALLLALAVYALLVLVSAAGAGVCAVQRLLPKQSGQINKASP